jgi:hypothetical protein
VALEKELGLHRQKRTLVGRSKCPLSADFVVEVGSFGCDVSASAFLKRLLITLLYGVGSLINFTDITHWLRETCIDCRWRSSNQFGEPTKVLGDSCQRELELGAVRAT